MTPEYFSLLRDHRDTKPQAIQADFKYLCTLLSEPKVRDNKAGPAWSPAKFNGNGRTDKDVEQIYFFAADIDNTGDGPKITRSALKKRLNGYAYHAHTSYSHSPDHERWRVAIPLARPVTPAEYRQIHAYLNGKVFDGALDKTGSPSHLFYLPACPQEKREFFDSFTVEGKPFDLDAVLIRRAQRNSELTRIAGQLRRDGAERDEIETALLRENEIRCVPPLNAREVRTIAASIARYEPEQKEETRPLRPLLLSAHELTEKDVPPRVAVVDPWLLLPSLTLIWALRGVGKTWFAMELARSIATGETFLRWTVPSARRVLYVDGEMPLADLKERLHLMCGDSPPENLDLLPSELLFHDGAPLNLNSVIEQGRVTDLLDALAAENRAPEVVIFDNLSSLAGGTDENSNSEIESLLRFLIGLRHRGLAVVLVHHAKKGGEDQRGASRREDLLDTSIRLSPPTDGIRSEGAHFVVSFSKLRGRRPNPDLLDVQLATGSDGRLEWLMSDATPQVARWIEVLKVLGDSPGTSLKLLAERFGVSKPTVSGHLKKARAKGLLGDDLMVTPAGSEYLAKVYGKEVSDDDFRGI